MEASASRTSDGSWCSRVSASEELRNELAHVALGRDCDRLAELSALVHTTGSVHLRGRGDVSVHLDVASAAVARRGFRLLSGFGVSSEIRTYARHAFDRSTRFQLHVGGGDRALQLLHEAGVLDRRLAPLEVPPKRVVARACCRGAYLRGALLGSGSFSGPRSPHLEIRRASAEAARFLASLGAREGAELGVLDRGRHAIAYAKGAEPIAQILAAAGAGGTVLGLEEQGVLGATRGQANRLANADHANLVRTARAAHVQLLAARFLRDTGRLEGLPAPLREIAVLRLDHPALPLVELALRCDPPTTKATAHRRLRTLVRLLDEGRAGGGAPRTSSPSG